jgi:hypothetical protein
MTSTRNFLRDCSPWSNLPKRLLLGSRGFDQVNGYGDPIFLSNGPADLAGTYPVGFRPGQFV